METLEYPYRARPLPMLGGAAFFAVAAVVLALIALAGESGLVIGRIIRLAPEQAAPVYWALSACSVGFVAAALWALYLSRHGTVPVRLTPSEISAPRFGFSRTPVVLPLDRVDDVSVMEVSGQRFMYVTGAGRRVSISRSMLPEGAFEAVQRELDARLRARRPE